VPEVWEISYDPNAEPVAEGLVHDFQYKEGHFKPGMFTRGGRCSRTTSTISSSPRATTRFSVLRVRQPRGQVIFLDGRKKVADLDLPGHAAPGVGHHLEVEGCGRRERTVMASPNLNAGLVTVIDLDTYENVKQIKTRGPGFFMRSHENSATPSPTR
jgi:hypothetical protein